MNKVSDKEKMKLRHGKEFILALSEAIGAQQWATAIEVMAAYNKAAKSIGALEIPDSEYTQKGAAPPAFYNAVAALNRDMETLCLDDIFSFKGCRNSEGGYNIKNLGQRLAEELSKLCAQFGSIPAALKYMRSNGDTPASSEEGGLVEDVKQVIGTERVVKRRKKTLPLVSKSLLLDAYYVGLLVNYYGEDALCVKLAEILGNNKSHILRDFRNRQRTGDELDKVFWSSKGLGNFFTVVYRGGEGYVEFNEGWTWELLKEEYFKHPTTAQAFYMLGGEVQEALQQSKHIRSATKYPDSDITGIYCTWGMTPKQLSDASKELADFLENATFVGGTAGPLPVKLSLTLEDVVSLEEGKASEDVLAIKNTAILSRADK
jgi:hypothetical protein